LLFGQAGWGTLTSAIAQRESLPELAELAEGIRTAVECHEAPSIPRPPGEGTALHRVARSGDAETAERLLALGASVAAQDRNGRTPLHEAAIEGHVAIVRRLLEHGAPTGERGLLGWTPLDEAVGAGRVEAAQLLLAHGADVNAASVRGARPLHIAAEAGDARIVRLLLDHGAWITGRPETYELRHELMPAPLSSAAEQGHIAVAQLLLERGALREPGGTRGAEALQAAAEHGRVELIRLLFMHAVRGEPPSGRSALALQMAVGAEEVEAVRVLLCFWPGALVAAEYDGESPLHIAARTGNLAIARLLLQYGFHGNHRDRYGGSPIDAAEPWGYVLVTDLLREFAYQDGVPETGFLGTWWRFRMKRGRNRRFSMAEDFRECFEHRLRVDCLAPIVVEDRR